MSTTAGGKQTKNVEVRLTFTADTTQAGKSVAALAADVAGLAAGYSPGGGGYNPGGGGGGYNPGVGVGNSGGISYRRASAAGGGSNAAAEAMASTAGSFALAAASDKSADKVAAAVTKSADKSEAAAKAKEPAAKASAAAEAGKVAADKAAAGKAAAANKFGAMGAFASPESAAGKAAAAAAPPPKGLIGRGLEALNQPVELNKSNAVAAMASIGVALEVVTKAFDFVDKLSRIGSTGNMKAEMIGLQESIPIIGGAVVAFTRLRQRVQEMSRISADARDRMEQYQEDTPEAIRSDQAGRAKAAQRIGLTTAAFDRRERVRQLGGFFAGQLAKEAGPAAMGGAMAAAPAEDERVSNARDSAARAAAESRAADTAASGDREDLVAQRGKTTEAARQSGRDSQLMIAVKGMLATDPDASQLVGDTALAKAERSGAAMTGALASEQAAITKAKESGLNAASKSYEMAKQETDVLKNQLEVLKEKAERVRSASAGYGGASGDDKDDFIEAAKMLKRGGIESLDQSQRGIVASNPITQKEYERQAVTAAGKDPRFQETLKDFGLQDSATLDEKVRSAKAEVNIKIVFDEKKMLAAVEIVMARYDQGMKEWIVKNSIAADQAAIRDDVKAKLAAAAK